VTYEGVTQDAADKMNKAVQLLENSLLGIRSGGITSACIETFKVPYYGQQTPIKHLATTIDATGRVMVSPFDPCLLGEIAKVLTEAGFNAYVFSKTSVAVASNAMSGVEREKVKAQIKKLGEEAKISVRNIRRDARKKIDHTLPEDDRLKVEVEIQNLTAKQEVKIEQVIDFKLKSLG
jgi:ribosome recycling factor